MVISVIKLCIAAVIPAFASLLVAMFLKTDKAKKISYPMQQLFIGIIFGLFAVLGTEWGIGINGAQVNCRDAAVVISGLMFGGPAGIIAGIIGGVERFIAVAWGVGSYTRIACSVSTVLAGVFSALLRHFLFEKKKPTWTMALASGIAIEVFHLMMVFITNMNDAVNAIVVIKNCTLPMVIANGLSVMFSSVLLYTHSFGRAHFSKKEKSKTSVFVVIQKSLFLVIVICTLVASLFVYTLENNIALAQTKSSIQESLNEVSEELIDRVNLSMVRICVLLDKDMHRGLFTLDELAAKYEISEICEVNSEGIIVNSNVPAYIGFDMSSGEQSAEFLCLLGDVEEYSQEFGPTSKDASVYRKYTGIKTDTGFLQIAYDADGLANEVQTEIEQLAENRHIGSDGYIVILDSDGEIVSATKGVYDLNVEVKSLIFNEENNMGIVHTNHGNYYYTYVDHESYYVCGLRPIEEAQVQRDIVVYLTTFLLILVFVVIFVVLYMLIKRTVINQIVKMADTLAVISSGNLNEVVNVRSNEEFASLSDDINRMVDTLKRYINEAAARIDTELEMARRIQSSVLPDAQALDIVSDCVEIAAKMDPAKEVGGDFYDFYMTDNRYLHTMIADVSGKGIPAAMFMMRAKSTLYNYTAQGLAVNQVFMNANHELCEGNDAEMFVTAWQMRLDTKTGFVQFVNAGHNPPVLKRADGKFEYIHQKVGLVLAAMDGVPYKVNEIQLQKGDTLLLYTDGVVEATDANNHLYGEDRLLRILNSKEFYSMEELLTKVRKDVDEFVGEAPQFDDLTMVAVKWGECEKANPKPKAILFDMDGVLIDSEKLMAKSGIRALEDYGIHPKPEDFLPFVGTGEDNYIGGVARKYGLTYTTDMKDLAYKYFGEKVKEEAFVPEGIQDILKELKNRGYKLAVCTSADRVKAIYNVGAMGMEPEFFDCFVTGDQITNKKPDPEIYLKGATMNGVAAEECIVVEDAISGVTAAHAGNMRAIAITTSFSSTELKEKVNPEWIIEDMHELLEIL